MGIVRVAHEEPLTADGRPKGDAIDVLMEHGDGFHQQKWPPYDLVSHEMNTSLSLILPKLYWKVGEKSRVRRKKGGPKATVQ